MVRSVLLLAALLRALAPMHIAETHVGQLPAAVSRVRASDSRAEDLIVEGCRRSPAFATLVQELQAANWIVFVQSGSCPVDGIAGCLLHRVGRYNGVKYLRIVVANGHGLDARTIATLGHELQHALEVVRDGQAADGLDILELYRRTGYIATRTPATQVYETQAAVRAGATILRQLQNPKEITQFGWGGCDL